jgi:hypothetical protein
MVFTKTGHCNRLSEKEFISLIALRVGKPIKDITNDDVIKIISSLL